MKIAIIGLGDIAQKAYLPVITKLPGVELTDELQSIPRTSLRQPNAHIAGGGFNHRIASL